MTAKLMTALNDCDIYDCEVYYCEVNECAEWLWFYDCEVNDCEVYDCCTVFTWEIIVIPHKYT